ncbi:BQ2448_6980 [Microbotryum intermedium]|uniref:BQ2448_6980 protein n=1 Tax=Microbotryum intermedium TaxID=269621 RepID=A0A238FIS6_9BASI|nr:BQ2448_6980 [Microbotryum intermedium]
MYLKLMFSTMLRSEEPLWWMYQRTVGSAAPACGIHVPIRSHRHREFL